MSKKKKQHTLDIIENPDEIKQGLEHLLQQARDNVLMIGLALGFILLCVIVGGVVRMNANATLVNDNTTYAKAMLEEEPGASLAALTAALEDDSTWTAEMTYVAAETALREQEYSQAEGYFQQVLDSFGDSEYAPRAKDGLGFILENRGENEAALSAYTEVVETWGDSFTGRREYLNIGRVQEALGNFEAAKEAYETQINRMPDSNIERKARMALDTLENSHPELFPEEVIAEIVETPAVEAEAAQ